MRLENLEVVAMGNTFEPEFHMTVEFSYEDDCKLPLKHNGYLFLGMRKIAFMHEYMFGSQTEMSFSSKNSNKGSKRVHRAVFLAPFSRLVLEKFDEARNRDPKGDLKFLVVLNVTFLEPQFNSTEYKPGQSMATFEHDSMFKLKSYDYKEEVRISASDWIHDFVPVFQNSKYQVFELPLPNLTSANGGLGDKINEAIKSIREMESAKLNGEWSLVVKESRPVWELIKNKTEIGDLLRNDGIDEAAITSFNTLISALFDFSSKFIHKVSHSKQLMSNVASKEDAELIYSLSVSIINLIAKKMNK